MSLQNLLNQFMGANTGETAADNTAQGFGGTLGKLASNIPGGLAGGAAAGGIMALLMTNKSARKFAGTAATVGGAALLGGLAYKAFRNWQANKSAQPGTHTSLSRTESDFVEQATKSADFQLTLIKAMIAAARADGHIDEMEQQRIFNAVDQMDLTPEVKGHVFDLLRQPIPINQLAGEVHSLEQKSELYLASCLVINPDHPSEQAHLDKLAQALELPADLARQLRQQAQQALLESV